MRPDNMQWFTGHWHARWQTDHIISVSTTVSMAVGNDHIISVRTTTVSMAVGNVGMAVSVKHSVYRTVSDVATGVCWEPCDDTTTSSRVTHTGLTSRLSSVNKLDWVIKNATL